MGYLLLSYLSPQLFFKIKTFVGLSHVFLNYNELSPYPKFLLIHDPKIKNFIVIIVIFYCNKYALYKTNKSQTVGHFYQHRPAKTAQSASCTVKSALMSDFI